MALEHSFPNSGTIWAPSGAEFSVDATGAYATFTRPGGATIGAGTWLCQVASGDYALVSTFGGMANPSGEYTQGFGIRASIPTYDPVTNPIVFLQVWVHTTGTTATYLTSMGSFAGTSYFDMLNPDAAWTPDEHQLAFAAYDPVYGATATTAPDLNGSRVRSLTDKSTSGTGIIAGAITGMDSWKFLMDDASACDFDVTVAGSTDVQATIYYHDADSPGTWVSDATYGQVPSNLGGNQYWVYDVFIQSSSSYNKYRSDGDGQITDEDWRRTSGEWSSSPGVTTYGPTPPYLDVTTPGSSPPTYGFQYAEPFAVFLYDATNSKGKWFAFGEALSEGLGAVTTDGATIDGPPAGASDDQPGFGGGYTVEFPDYDGSPDGLEAAPLPDLPETPRVPIIRDPSGNDVTPPGAQPLPPGIGPNPVVRYIFVGRMLWVTYGGSVLTTYVIPSATWDALPAGSQTYVGYYVASSSTEALTPAASTITLASPGFTFSWGSYRTNLGSEPKLWEYAQIEATKDFLVDGDGDVTVTELPTDAQVTAATKVVLGGRDRDAQSTLTYTEALQVADAHGANLLYPMQVS